ncbi:DNA-binding transcriptional regulator, LysR family [Noviherbaspirillum humi]|uniref:DNA-binding transcriptional regulator, LysR family n=1 Tax=Noviherbaspirillum humi TaxID=1688639 RepID=A0A239I2Q1_9BURK|nr:LysR family transcriptional regulator [Noviherbaspirillum humi]SNS87799.1 DNA-binding transcriptional regulator, LysR family [Noviherbaspirillum humi]
MNASFRQLRAFVTVVECSSFTKAAEKLFITQAGLSAMIKDLERQLNCALLVRTTRLVAPTPAGQKLLPAALRALRELEQVGWEINERNSGGQAPLKIGITPLAAASFAPRVIKRHLDAHPGSRVDLVDASRDEVQSMVEAGELDAGFGVFFTRVAGLKRHALFPTPLMAVTPRRRGRRTPAPPTRWADLAGQPLVTLPDDNPIQQLVDRHLPKAKGARAERIVLRNLEAAIAFVDQGFGIAVMPTIARLACTRYEVDCTLLREPEVTLDYYGITRAGAKPSAALGDLLQEFARAGEGLG